jgi:hypothetical protein
MLPTWLRTAVLRQRGKHLYVQTGLVSSKQAVCESWGLRLAVCRLGCGGAELAPVCYYRTVTESGHPDIEPCKKLSNEHRNSVVPPGLVLQGSPSKL